MFAFLAFTSLHLKLFLAASVKHAETHTKEGCASSQKQIHTKTRRFDHQQHRVKTVCFGIDLQSSQQYIQKNAILLIKKNRKFIEKNGQKIGHRKNGQKSDPRKTDGNRTAEKSGQRKKADGNRTAEKADGNRTPDKQKEI